MLFDTHTHTFFHEFAGKQEEILARMREKNVRYATQIGCDTKTSREAIEFTKIYKPYFATVGWHPVESQDLMDDAIIQAEKDIETLLREERDHIVAIGEIGFDYFHLTPGKETEQKEAQKTMFFTMTALAKKYDLPVVIHSRNAGEDTLRYIKESGITKFVIHCFSETPWFAREILEYSKDAYFGFTGIVTFPKADPIREVARELDLDRILIETDAPFLAPQAVRGTINSPANVAYVLETIQSLRTEDATEVENRIFENSLRFYGIDRQ